jgi:hypothetical protein
MGVTPMATSSHNNPLAADSDPAEILRALRGVPEPHPPHMTPNEPIVPFPSSRWQAPDPPPQPVPPPQAPLRFTAPPTTAPTPVQMLQMANAIGKIAATRMLLLLVLLCAGGLWTLTVLEPEPYRIASASIFSCLVLWPIAWLAARR